MTHERSQKKPGGTWVIWISGLILWLIGQYTLVIVPLTTRALPAEVDDTYAYLVKSAQMETCFWQDCPALRDLYAQVDAPTSHPERAYQRVRAHVRLILVYTPLYSATLTGLKQTGLSWEQTHTLITLIGPLFFGLVFAYWLRTLWGMAPAGIALGLLAFHVFPDQGIHYVVPSNLAMGIAVLIWTRIILRRGDAPWSLVIGSLLLVSMHSIGLMYAVIAALLALLSGGFPHTRRAWVAMTCTGIVLSATFILPMLIHHPDLTIRPYPYPKGYTWSKEWVTTLQIAASIVVGYAQHIAPIGIIASGIIVIGALIVGYKTLDTNRHTYLIWITLILIACVALSLFYVRPHFPASLFRRVWVPLAILFTGAIGQAIWYAIQRIHASMEQRFQVQRMLVLVTIGLLLLTTYMRAPFIDSAWHRQMIHMQESQNMNLAPTQPSLLLAQAKPEDRVLYMHEIQRDFYLTHGALELGAVFYRMLAGTPEEELWLQHPDLHFAVIWDPVEALMLDPERAPMVRGPNGDIVTDALQWMNVEPTIAPKSQFLKLLVHNVGAAGRIDIVPVDADQQRHPEQGVGVDVPANWSGWLEINLELAPNAQSWDIGFPVSSAHILIGGLVFGEDTLQWPWKQRATLRMTLQSNGEGKGEIFTTVHFDPLKHVPEQLKDNDMYVLDDQGATVLIHMSKHR